MNGSTTASSSDKLSATPNDIQIRVRPFRSSDEKEVQDLFVEAMTVGDEAPFPIAMRAMWTEPMSFLIYIISLAGLSAYTLSQNYLTRYTGLGFAVISMSLLFSYRFLLAAKFKDFSKEAFKGDMGNIEVHYDIQELQSGANEKVVVPKNGFWVAEAYGQDVKPSIVGMAALDMRTNADPYSGELRRVVVSPRSRRQGVARKLLRVLVEHAKSQGVKSIFLSTSQYQEPAIHLYKRLGWKDAYSLNKRFMLNVVTIRGLRLDVEDYSD